MNDAKASTQILPCAVFFCFLSVVFPPQTQGGKYGARLSLGAQDCIVENNVMSDSFRYGVFFYRGSDEAEVSSK